MRMAVLGSHLISCELMHEGAEGRCNMESHVAEHVGEAVSGEEHFEIGRGVRSYGSFLHSAHQLCRLQCASL